jgi:Protease inhibitor Inh
MIGLAYMGHGKLGAVKAAAALLVLAALSACASSERFGGGQPEPSSTPTPPPPPTPPPLQPPPIDLAGKWRLSVAAGGACLMTLGDTAGATDGSVAPAGGCPGNFFTSRKWTFEHDRLIMRDHKGEPLAELSFANGHFEGQGTGGAITLARP